MSENIRVGTFYHFFFLFHSFLKQSTGFISSPGPPFLFSSSSSSSSTSSIRLLLFLTPPLPAAAWWMSRFRRSNKTIIPVLRLCQHAFSKSSLLPKKRGWHSERSSSESQPRRAGQFSKIISEHLELLLFNREAALKPNMTDSGFHPWLSASRASFGAEIKHVVQL